MEDSLNDTEYNILTDDSETETPVFYGLPKIHKEYERFPPLRPIVAGYRSATVQLSEYVDSYLKPAARKRFSFVRDTTHFLNRLGDLKNIPVRSFMVAMDVNGLYNNIDHEEGANACYMHCLRETQTKENIIGYLEVHDIIHPQKQCFPIL